ncbi:hypothetical protein R1flu_000617 [Riccia fluitans]|uniref:Uncharacterized protein n=1 Tax=Riccia fluitans TaxID=41844 RepID=A0ABD1Y0Z7_9MARC
MDEATGRRRTRIIDHLGRDEADEAAGRRRTRISDCLERDEAAGQSWTRQNSFRTRLNAHLNIRNPILCNPRDNWCRVFEENTDAEGDHLLVKDARGGTNVIGWNKIAVIFGAKHNDLEDFRSIKVMHTTLDKYNPRAYLPASVEHHPNKKLVSGQPYEEVLYYKDAAPYGPTYCLMTTVAELFWSAGRSNRFLTPMILAYLCGLHGHGYNWAKAICMVFGTKFTSCSPEHATMRRCQLPEEIPIASPEQAVSTRRPRAEDKQPEEFVPASPEQPVSSQRPEDIPIASPKQPVSSKRPRAKDKEHGLPSKKKNKRHIAAIDTWKQEYEVELSKVRELQATNDGLRGQLAAKDAAKSEVHALARTEVQCELEELKRSVTELEDFKRSVTHLQKLALVQTQLEETKRSSEASNKRLEEEASRLREALAAKDSVVQVLENAHHKEISTLKATCRKYKTSLDGEIGTNADLHTRLLNLQDELNTSKYTQEQAL